jgi:hypothetical protein
MLPPSRLYFLTEKTEDSQGQSPSGIGKEGLAQEVTLKVMVHITH